MFVDPVPCVQNARLHGFSKQVRRASHGMTHDDEIIFLRVESFTRVHERFSLGNRGIPCHDIDGGHTKVLGGLFKARTRSRTVFIKENGGCFASQIPKLLLPRFDAVFEFVGKV